MHSSDEEGYHAFPYQVRVFELLHNLNVVELDVQVLVHAFQNTLELDVIFELHGDLMVDECLEEAIISPSKD